MGTHSGYKRKAQIAVITITVLSSLAVIALLVALIYYCYRRSKLYNLPDNRPYAGHNGESDFVNLQVVADNGLQVLTFKQLHSAANGFSKSNVTGHGGFGLVYRGVLNDGRNVAIKFMDESRKQGEEEFKKEVELLGQLRGPYLLKLIGYFSDSNRKLLVYEFMTNGNLKEHLHPVSNSYVTRMKLDWSTRLRIALEGLEYLHEHVSPPVIHGDFKSSNVLLDTQFDAKVSDFGLAKLGSDKAGGHISTQVLGTNGYVDPDYGVLLLELLTGRLPVDIEKSLGEGVLVFWVRLIFFLLSICEVS